MIKMIFAMTEEGVIGNKQKLPWKIPEELQHFKETTKNSDLLMGRKTFDSLPKKLPGRKHIVLSTQKHIEIADLVINSEEEIKQLFEKYRNNKDLFIIGGKSLIEKFYTLSDELIITIIKQNYPGDIKVNIDLKKWKKTVIKNDNEFIIYLYKKEL